MFCEKNTPIQLFVGSIDSNGLSRFGPCPYSDTDAEIYVYSPSQVADRRKLEIVDVQEGMGTYMDEKWLNSTRKQLDGNEIPYVEIIVTYVVLKLNDMNSGELELVMQEILNDNIDEYLETNIVGIQEIAAVGNERASFQQFFSNKLMTPEELKRDLSPMHGIRVVGIIMLASVILTFIVIIKSAQRRHVRKEWDAMNMDKGKGGLGTQEGLDFMLETGRNFDGITEENDVEVVINKKSCEPSKRGVGFT